MRIQEDEVVKIDSCMFLSHLNLIPTSKQFNILLVRISFAFNYSLLARFSGISL